MSQERVCSECLCSNTNSLALNAWTTSAVPYGVPYDPSYFRLKYKTNFHKMINRLYELCGTKGGWIVFVCEMKQAMTDE